MQALLWGVYLAGALTSSYFFGPTGRIAYLGVVGVVLFAFRRPLTFALTHAASKFGLIKATIEKMPLAISLARAPGLDPLAQPVAAELRKAGFTDAGAWNIPPLPKIKLALMVHRGENVLAAIETAAAIGAQVNIHTLYDDGTVTSFTNTRLPAPRALRPEVTYVRAPGLAPAALFEKALRERRRDSIRAITVEDAPRVYEKLYADSIRYRRAKGL